jgi:hypothetical protein
MHFTRAKSALALICGIGKSPGISGMVANEASTFYPGLTGEV